MTSASDEAKILAFAVYELRLLLAQHLGSDASGETPVRTAAHLAYALHNQALAVLDGKSFDPSQAIEAVAAVDRAFGENFAHRLSEAVSHAV